MQKRAAGRPEQYPVKKVIGFEQEMLDAVDAWRGARIPIVNSSEAIRRILAEYLREHGYLKDSETARDGEGSEARSKAGPEEGI